MYGKLLFGSLFLIFISIFSSAQVNLSGYKMIANYPLTADGKEASGWYPEMTLLGNFAFKNGGLFSNGIYGGTNRCYINSPTIDSMKITDFILLLEFKVDSVPSGWDPVFMVGQLWRLLGVGLYKQDSTLFFYKNGNYFVSNRSTFKYKMNTWYSLALKHKTDVSSLYVNDKLVLTHNGVLDFGTNMKDPTHRQISNVHSGNGIAYKGYWRNLKVYAPSIAQNLDDQSKKPDIAVFPNPSSGKIYIDLTSVPLSDDILISLTDLKGTNLFLQKVTRPNSVICVEKPLAQGCYFVHVMNSAVNVTKKIIVH